MDPSAPREAPDVEASRAEMEPRAADLARFRAIFQKELAYVWTSLRRLGIREGEREDLAHEVFFRVYRRLDDYDETRPVRPWLFAFAVRVAAQHRRRAQIRHEHVGSDADVADLVAAPRADRAAEESEIVYAGLAAVPIDRRAVLVLHDLDGYTAAEIATALSIPEGTVYTRLRAARADFTAVVQRLRRSER